MRLIKACLNNPVAVAVTVAMVMMIGAYSLFRLPIQLFPDIERPQISIQTEWRAASPQEVESELIEPQEDVLQGIPGMIEMVSYANPGNSYVGLTFSLDTDMQAALVEVISRLNRVQNLPDDADPPIIQSSAEGDSNSSLVFFFMQVLPGNTKQPQDYAGFVEDVVIPRLEAVPGVAGVTFYESRERTEELQIIFDPFRAAELGISIPQIAQTVGSADDSSGGFQTMGRRQYQIRFEGRYSPEELRQLILEWRDGRPIRLGDVAEVKLGNADQQSFTFQNGNPALGMRVLRENGANVLDTLSAILKVADEINAGPAAEQGVKLQKSFDPSVFISRAVSLLSGNLTVGLLLSLGVLWLFMRSWRAVAIVAATIPVCLLASFIVLDMAGRTINVISLAGIAFALGMVFDAAIIVIENIMSVRAKGVQEPKATLLGTSQVWGALIASTITMVAIFIPIVFLKDVEGQLFADLSLNIAISVVLALIIGVTIVPVLVRRYLRPSDGIAEDGHAGDNRIVDWIMRATGTKQLRRFWLLTLIAGSVVGSFVLMPTLSYLPVVKRDAIDSFIALPSGATVEMAKTEIAHTIIERMKPYMEGTKEPAVLNYYVSLWGPWGMDFAVRVIEEDRLLEMGQIIKNEILVGFPDTFVFSQQGSLFGGFGSEDGIRIHLQAGETVDLYNAALQGPDIVRAALPGVNVRANPEPDVTQPELRIYPNDQRILEVGLTRGAVANILRSLGSGLYAGEYFEGTRRVNIIVRSPRWSGVQALATTPIATPSGQIVPFGDLARVEETVGPGGIARVDKHRTITLDVSPPEDMSLQDALEIIQRDVEPKLRALMPEDGRITYGGSASGLTNAINTMVQNFLFALTLLFLIMAALFRSLWDSFLVAITLPLAIVGGMAALQVVNFFTLQPLDLLTMIGVILLMGLVVNNAILLVVQTRAGEAQGLSLTDAVAQSLKLRMRPIFASTLTNIVSTLPMVVVPGEGSDIYRGLATVIVGGMAVSTLFTLILLPALIRLRDDKVAVRLPRWIGGFGGADKVPAE